MQDIQYTMLHIQNVVSHTIFLPYACTQVKIWVLFISYFLPQQTNRLPIHTILLKNYKKENAYVNGLVRSNKKWFTPFYSKSAILVF
jgi:hypothetical protein